MSLLKPFFPGTGIPLPRRPQPTAYTPPQSVNNNTLAPLLGGSGGKGDKPTGTTSDFIGRAQGWKEIKNPWEAAMKANYETSKANPYQNEWRQGVNQAMTLGNRDYEGALRGFAQEDVQKQIQTADNQLGSIGMRELALRGDVQAERGKMATDASTRAMIESQGIKSDALQTMQSMLGAASGAELNRISQMITAASAGAGNYLEFQQFAVPLQEKFKNMANSGGTLASGSGQRPSAAYIAGRNPSTNGVGVRAGLPGSRYGKLV